MGRKESYTTEWAQCEAPSKSEEFSQSLNKKHFDAWGKIALIILITNNTDSSKVMHFSINKYYFRQMFKSDGKIST